MITPSRIIEKLHRLDSELNEADKELLDVCDLKAISERDYRVALAKRVITLKAHGDRATLIPDLARGDEKVAELKLERDKWEAVYEAKKLRVKSLHARLTMGQTLLNNAKVEYQNANYLNP